MATRTALLAAVLLAGLTVPWLAAAQPHGPGPQGDAVGLDMFLGAVVRDWQQAWEMNRQTNSPEVRSHLTHAKALLDEARMERDRGNLPRAWALAESGAAFVRRANEMLRLRDRQGAPQQTEQALREAEEMLDRLRRLGPMGPRTGEVERLIEQARKATAEGHSQVALRCALMAQDQGRRGWQESMHARMAAQRSRVLETVVEPLVEQAMRLAQERKDERMTAVASRAQEHLYMARQMDTETQGGPKARLLESAMREAELVLRTLDEAGYARHRSERLVSEAEAALDRAREVAAEQGKGDVTDLIERGRNLLDQAREKLQSGDTDAAEALAEQGRGLAQAAIRASLGPLDQNRVEEALSRTDQLIEQAGGVTGEAARELLADARRRQDEARQLLADARLRRALAQTRIAARLAQRAYDLDQGK